MNIFDNELDFACPNNEGYRLHIARTPTMREIVYRLRYRAYTDAGVKLHRDDGIFPDKFDRCRNCISHVLLQNGIVIGSIRANRCTCADDSVGAQEAYADDIAAAIGTGQTYVESNRFVVDPDVSNKSLAPLRCLFRGIVLHAALIDADWVITAVRTRHIAFYRRILGMEQLSEPKPYPLLTGEFALMGINYQTKAEAVYRRLLDLRPTDELVQHYAQAVGYQ